MTEAICSLGVGLDMDLGRSLASTRAFCKAMIIFFKRVTWDRRVSSWAAVSMDGVGLEHLECRLGITVELREQSERGKLS